MSLIPPLPTRPFDFTLVTVTWGPYVLTGGLVDIKVGRDEDGWTKHVATDGTVTRVRNNNRTGALTLVYTQNALALDVLSAQAQLDEASGTAQYPVEIKDGNGRSLAAAPFAWIKKFPDVSYEKEGSTREWAFDCDQLTTFVGGLN